MQDREITVTLTKEQAADVVKAWDSQEYFIHKSMLILLEVDRFMIKSMDSLVTDIRSELEERDKHD